MAEVNLRQMERNRAAEALQRIAYKTPAERWYTEDAGQLDEALAKLNAASERIATLEAHIAWMQREIAAIVERVTLYEVSEAWVARLVTEPAGVRA